MQVGNQHRNNARRSHVPDYFDRARQLACRDRHGHCHGGIRSNHRTRGRHDGKTANSLAVQAQSFGTIAGSSTKSRNVSSGATTDTTTTTGDTVQIADEARQQATASQSATPNTTANAREMTASETSQPQGGTTVVGTALTASGRQVSIQQYTRTTTATDGSGMSLTQSGLLVSVSGNEEEPGRSYLLTGDTILTEDKNGVLSVSAYRAGQEPSGADIIIEVSGAALSGGAGDDTIFDFSRTGAESIQGGAGNDTISASSIGFGGTQVNTGAGNDSVTADMLEFRIESFAWEHLVQGMVENTQDSGNGDGNVIAGEGYFLHPK